LRRGSLILRNGFPYAPSPSSSPPIFTHSNISRLSIEDAIKAQHPYISYCVAKAEAEKAIWKYVSENNLHFSVSVLLPAIIFGPPIQYVESLKKINYSSDVFYSLFNGTYEVVPPTSFPSYVCSPFLPFPPPPNLVVWRENMILIEWDIDRCPRPSNSIYPFPHRPSSCKSTLLSGRKEIFFSDSSQCP